MPDPMKNVEGRTVIESIARWIPGFRGYLEKEYRREGDALARKWMADRLDKSKPSVDQLIRDLTSQGQLGSLDDLGRIQSKLDHLVNRFRSAPQGYSGFFDFVRIRPDALDEVYAHDASMFSSVDALAGRVESLPQSGSDAAEAVRVVSGDIDNVGRLFDQRGEILSGLKEDNDETKV